MPLVPDAGEGEWRFILHLENSRVVSIVQSASNPKQRSFTLLERYNPLTVNLESLKFQIGMSEVSTRHLAALLVRDDWGLAGKALVS